MSQKKPSKPSRPEAEQPKGRSRVYNLRLSHDLDAVIDRFVSLQKVPPDKSAVIMAAVIKYMTDEGLWPPPEQE